MRRCDKPSRARWYGSHFDMLHVQACSASKVWLKIAGQHVS